MDSFIREWIGKRVDFDHRYEYQCVDLVKQYLYQKFGITAGAWGDAKHYYESTNKAILEKMDRINTKDVQAGDIVVLKGLDKANEYGHIGIATGAQRDDEVEILEQNGSTGNGSGTGNDAIRTRFIPKSRMYGVLRQKVVTKKHPLAHWVGKTVYLKPVTTAWRVYEAGSIAPRNKIGTVNPIKHKPLKYKVLDVDKMPNSVIIYSPHYGKRISLPIDGDAVLE